MTTEYKFLGYMQTTRKLTHLTISKMESLGCQLINEHPPQLEVDRYMITVGTYKYYGIDYWLQAYYYGQDFNKMRFIFSRNGEREIIMYLKRSPTSSS